jgi:RNA polymerase sigma factor (sigma-70 family)
LGEPPIRIEELLAHRDWLTRLARDLFGAGRGAQDAVQETWLAAMRRPPEHRAGLKGWLATVLRNRFRNAWTADERRRRRERVAARPERTEDTSVLAERIELERSVSRWVLDLPEPSRTTVILRYYRGLKPAEIARELGEPAGTVRSRLTRARDRLRARVLAETGREGLLALAPLLTPWRSAVETLSTNLATTSLAAGAIMALKLKIGIAAVCLCAVIFGVRAASLFGRAPAGEDFLPGRVSATLAGDLREARATREELEMRARALESSADREVGSAPSVEPWATAVFRRGGLRDKVAALCEIDERDERLRGRRELAHVLMAGGQDAALRILGLLRTEKGPALLTELGEILLQGAIYRAKGEVRTGLPELARKGDRPERRLAALRGMIRFHVDFPASGVERILREHERSPVVLAGALDAMSIWKNMLPDVSFVESLAEEHGDPAVRRAAVRVLVRHPLEYGLARVIEKIGSLSGDRQQEWISALAFGGPGRVEGLSPREVRERLLDVWALAVDLDDRRRLALGAAQAPMDDLPAFYDQAAAQEREPDLRRQMRAAAASLRREDAAKTPPSTTVWRAFRDVR